MDTRSCNKISSIGTVRYLAVSQVFVLLLNLMAFSLPGYAQQNEYESPGIKDNLPIFYKNMAGRQVYTLSWLQGDKGDFSIWRQKARAKVMECLLTPPPAVPFNPVVISEQDRGSYVARKIVFKGISKNPLLI